MNIAKKFAKASIIMKGWKALHSQTPAHNEEIIGIVFSKDRPLQLYALLESYFRHCEDPKTLYILYRASNDAFANAYTQVKQYFDSNLIEFVEEQHFTKNFQSLLESTEEKYVFHLVDDNIFTSPFSFTDFLAIENRDTCLFSLRLGDHITYSYTRQSNQSLPEFSREGQFLTWKLATSKSDWDYPFSVDGNIYIKSEILALSKLIEFKAPNSFEGKMTVFEILLRKRRGICYPHSKLINVCLNRVQDEAKNIAGEYSPEELLGYWNNGKKLDITKFEGIIPPSAHIEIDSLPLVDRQ